MKTALATALLLALGASAHAQIPVIDATSIAQLIQEVEQAKLHLEQLKGLHTDFDLYLDGWIREELPLDGLGYYTGKWDPSWLAKPVRNSFGRVQHFVDAENDGYAIHVKPGYEAATAWKLTPPSDGASNQDQVEDTSVLIDAADSQVQNALIAVGDYRREQREELDNMLVSLQYELTDPIQDDKAIRQRILTAGVLTSRELSFTNRLLAELVMLNSLQVMGTRNGLAYGVNANTMAAQDLGGHLSFMDNAEPVLNTAE